MRRSLKTPYRTVGRNIKVRDAKFGKGLFAARAFAEDEEIGRVTGDVVEDDSIDPRYVMELDGDLLMVPGEPFRFLNHSCEPNCTLFMWEEDQKDEELGSRPLYVGALRDIEPGEELTIDYQWPAHFAIKCGCGARRCRGWIVDETELEELKKDIARKRRKKKSKAARAKS